jgi:hypothetical protein
MDQLTQRQLRRIQELDDGWRPVAEHDGSPILERPDGRHVLVDPHGRMAATGLVLRVRSYLNVGRC